MTRFIWYERQCRNEELRNTVNKKQQKLCQSIACLMLYWRIHVEFYSAYFMQFNPKTIEQRTKLKKQRVQERKAAPFDCKIMFICILASVLDWSFYECIKTNEGNPKSCTEIGFQCFFLFVKVSKGTQQIMKQAILLQFSYSAIWRALSWRLKNVIRLYLNNILPILTTLRRSVLWNHKVSLSIFGYYIIIWAKYFKGVLVQKIKKYIYIL